MPGVGEARQGCVQASGVPQVGDEDGDRASASGREPLGHLQKVSPSGCPRPLEVLEDSVDRAPTPCGAPLSAKTPVGDEQLNPVQAAERRPGDSRRGLPRRIPLRSRHGRGPVEDDLHRAVLARLEQLDEQGVEAGIQVPVQVTNVVAGYVLPVIRELEALPPPTGSVAALPCAGGPGTGPQRQLLETGQEGMIEQAESVP